MLKARRIADAGERSERFSLPVRQWFAAARLIDERDGLMNQFQPSSLGRVLSDERTNLFAAFYGNCISSRKRDHLRSTEIRHWFA